MTGSRKVVYAGLATNVVIALTKLVVAVATGSSAMFAETLHSVVDTGNSLLLLYGIRRSQRPAHRHHPFGHGKELYFWSFVVAVSMFAVGGVVSIWEGASHLRHVQPVTRPLWSYLVLGVSSAISAVSLVIALREVNRRKGRFGIVDFIRRSKDPTVFTVVLEDAGDIIGQFIAFVAILLSVKLQSPLLDGLGSIAVGLTILAVSVVLANESRDLLIGERAPPKDVERMKQLLERDWAVDRVGDLLTMQLGPNEILLNVEIQFQRQSCVDDLEQTIERLETRIRREYPEVRQLFVEVARLKNIARKLPRAS